MKKIRALVRATGGGRYAVKVEGIGNDGHEVVTYKKMTITDPERCARHCAGAYVKGYNQAVEDFSKKLIADLLVQHDGKYGK